MATVRITKEDRLAGTLRLMLGVLFVMTGVMKLAVPMLADAWSGQLLASGLPFITLTRWAVPFVEIAVGVVLLAGTYVRFAVLVVIGIMIVATYVHLTVDDPTLFPLQPSEPIIPIIVILMAFYVLWKGGGSWSRDLRAQEAGRDQVEISQ